MLGASAAALGGLLFGFDTAVISGTTHALTKVFSLTQTQLGITVSSALWGTILGAWGAGNAGRKYGSRDSLKVAGALYVLSAIGCAVAWKLPILVLARILGGLGIGCSSVLAPVYIAEISPASSRGRMVGLFQLNVVVGILLAYLSNFLLSSLNLGEILWRWQLAVSALPALIFFVLLFLIPSSPRWLLQQGRYREARAILQQAGSADPSAELARIAASLAEEDRASAERLFCRAHVRPILLATSIAVFSQLSGINAVLYYLNDIFSATGSSLESSGLQTLAVGLTNLFATGLAMLTIDRFGRRPLLMIGAAGMCLTMGGIALVFVTGSHTHWLVYLLIGYCGFFSFSLGAVVWVYISELFPNNVRVKGQSFASLTHWAMNAVISIAFPIAAARHLAAAFLFFALMMAVQFIAAALWYPETTNKSLEDIQSLIEG